MDRDVGVIAGERTAYIGGSCAVILYQRNKVDRFSRINEPITVPSRIINGIVIVEDYRYRRGKIERDVVGGDLRRF